MSAIEQRITAASAAIRAQPGNIEDASFLHSVLCQCALPRKAVEGRTFERRMQGGAASLLLEAGRLWIGSEWVDQPLPYGSRPRVALVYLISEAVRTQSPTVDVGASTHAFLKRLGVDTNGKGYARFKAQMRALAACRMTLGFTTGGISRTVDSKIVREFQAWTTDSDEQGVIWPGIVTLTTDFYQAVAEHAVPLDTRAIAALSHSSLALDLYAYLSHRLYRVQRQDGVLLPWQTVMDQFGQEYATRSPRAFRQEFREALRQVQQVYPGAKLEDAGTKGLRLLPSRPPISQAQVQVALPSPAAND